MATENNLKEFADKLVASEIEKDPATAMARVEKIYTGIKQRFTKESADFHMSTLKAAIRTLVSTKVTQINAVIVGFTDKQDSNSYAKYQAMEAWKSDQSKAIKEGYIALDKDGKVVFEVDEQTKKPKKDKDGNMIPVAADAREFIDKEKTKKNSRFGKPLGTKLQRTLVLIVTDDKGNQKFMKAYGNVDPKQGAEYNVYGTIAANGKYITIPDQGPGIQLVKTLDIAPYWAVINKVAQADEMAVLLGDVPNLDKNTFVVTKGFVGKIQPNARGQTVVLNDDTLPEGMVGFTNDAGVSEEAESLGPGNEVIVVGRINDMPDQRNPGKIVKSLTIMGFACNPESDKVADATRDISDLLYT